MSIYKIYCYLCQGGKKENDHLGVRGTIDVTIIITVPDHRYRYIKERWYINGYSNSRS